MNRTPILAAVLASTSLFSQEITGLPGWDGDFANRTLIESRAGGADKNSVRQIPVFSADNVVPHLADGAGWSSAITLTNMEPRRLRVRVLFIRDDGSDLVLPIAGLGPVTMVEVTLNPGGSATFQTSGTAAALASGWAYIVKEVFTDSIGGICVFRQRVSGRPDFEAVVPVISEFDRRGVLLFDNTGGFTTAAALANPNLDSQPVAFIVRGEDGVVLETKTITLGTLNHQAGTIPQLFAQTAGKRGSIEFNTSGPGVSIMGLRFNPGGAFTSFHTLTNIRWLIN